MKSPVRILAMAVALSFVALGAGGCKSEKEKKKEHAKCKAACISQHLPDGQGNAPSIETALRRSQGGGQCLTICNKILIPSDFMKKMTNFFN